MAKSLAPELTKRVIYSKYLMKRATTLQAEGHELALAEAVLVAHDSVEMLTRVVADELKVAPPQEFMRFWKAVENKVGKEPPRKAAMDRLNHERVGFKHKGIPPNPATVGDLLRNAVAFCEEITREYLDVDYESVSLADLIQNADAREKVKEAETAKANGDLKGAIIALALAYDVLLEEARKKHQASLIGEINLPIPDRKLALEFAGVGRQLSKLVSIVDGFTLGIDPTRYRRFVRIVPARRRYASGRVDILWLGSSTKSTEAEFDYCYAFIVDLGLRFT
jgi:hypothetical protein